MSVNAQMDVVFNTNPPDVLIYLSFPDSDLHSYIDGLVLESMKHNHLTQIFHMNKKLTQNKQTFIKWNKLLRDKTITEIEHDNYKEYSFTVVDEIVQQFDPNFVITLDGRKPVTELFEIIKAKLMTMPLQRTVLPVVVRGRDNVLQKENLINPYKMDELQEYEMESLDTDDEAISIEHNTSETFEYYWNNYRMPNSKERNEQIRLMSGLRQLCPINFSYGLYILGSDHYRVNYMGKTYFFAGLEEMELFIKHPRQFLEIPTTGISIRAIFYGPEWLSSPAAIAVSNFYKYNLIDVKYIKQKFAENEKQSFFSTVFKSVLKTAQKVIEIKKDPSSDIENMRNAIGEWIQLNFKNSVELKFVGAEGDKIESFDDYTKQGNFFYVKILMSIYRVNMDQFYTNRLYYD